MSYKLTLFLVDVLCLKTSTSCVAERFLLITENAENSEQSITTSTKIPSRVQQLQSKLSELLAPQRKASDLLEDPWIPWHVAVGVGSSGAFASRISPTAFPPKNHTAPSKHILLISSLLTSGRCSFDTNCKT